MSNDKLAEMAKKIAELEAANAALKAQGARKVSLKVSEKGAVSVYGMGRFPVTLYQEQWGKLLDMADEVRGFITTHSNVLVGKDDDEATKAAKLVARRALFAAAGREFEASEVPAAPGKPAVTAPPTTVAKVVTRHNVR